MHIKSMTASLGPSLTGVSLRSVDTQESDCSMIVCLPPWRAAGEALTSKGQIAISFSRELIPARV